MLVETTRFGSITVAENDIVTFPEGMLGFSKINEYVLVERVEDVQAASGRSEPQAAVSHVDAGKGRSPDARVVLKSCSVRQTGSTRRPTAASRAVFRPASHMSLDDPQASGGT